MMKRSRKKMKNSGLLCGAVRATWWALLAIAAGCASSGGEKKAAGGASDANNSSGSKSEVKAGTEEAKKEEKQSVSGTTRFVTTTLNNENVVQGSASPNLVSDAIVDFDELTRKDSDNVALVTTYLALLRLHGQGSDIYKSIERKAGGVGAKNPWFLIEASYGALTRREFALAEYLLSKAERNAGGNPQIKAAVQHAYGVRYLVDKKVQQGVSEMRKAAEGNYLPALLTLGFLALRSGDYPGAERTFRAAAAADGENLNARLGLAVALRTRGKAEEAVPLIASVYKIKTQDRRVAWNYALALSEVPSLKKEASEVLNKYFQMPGTLGEIDARANALMAKLNAPPPPPPAPAAPAAAASEKSASGVPKPSVEGAKPAADKPSDKPAGAAPAPGKPSAAAPTTK